MLDMSEVSPEYIISYPKDVASNVLVQSFKLLWLVCVKVYIVGTDVLRA